MPAGWVQSLGRRCMGNTARQVSIGLLLRSISARSDLVDRCFLRSCPHNVHLQVRGGHGPAKPTYGTPYNGWEPPIDNGWHKWAAEFMGTVMWYASHSNSPRKESCGPSLRCDFCSSSSFVCVSCVSILSVSLAPVVDFGHLRPAFGRVACTPQYTPFTGACIQVLGFLPHEGGWPDCVPWCASVSAPRPWRRPWRRRAPLIATVDAH